MNEYSNKLIRWLVVFTTLFMLVAPLGNLMLNYIFRIPALFIIVLSVINNYRRIPIKYQISILLFSFIFLIHFAIDVDIDFNIILSTISIILFLLLVAESNLVTITPYTKKILNYCSIISAMSLIVYSLSPIAYRAEHEGFIYYGPYLTFGFDNSNYAGIVALMVYSIIYVTQSGHGRFNKAFCLVLELILLYLIYKTNSRTALIAALSIPILQLFFLRRRIPKMILFIFLMVPFMFIPFYIYWGNEIGSGEVEVMGKGIMTGRDLIYKNSLNTLSDNFYILLGNLQKNPLQNAHNGPLAVFVSTGIIGTVLYFYVLFSVIFKIHRNASDFNSIAALFIILACILNTSAEAALLLGGFPAITYLFVFYVFGNSCFGYEGKN